MLHGTTVNNMVYIPRELPKRVARVSISRFVTLVLRSVGRLIKKTNLTQCLSCKTGKLVLSTSPISICPFEELADLGWVGTKGAGADHHALWESEDMFTHRNAIVAHAHDGFSMRLLANCIGVSTKVTILHVCAHEGRALGLLDGEGSAHNGCFGVNVKKEPNHFDFVNRHVLVGEVVVAENVGAFGTVLRELKVKEHGVVTEGIEQHDGGFCLIRGGGGGQVRS